MPKKARVIEKSATGIQTVVRAPVTDLLKQYGCGTIKFTGVNGALYDRHLHFDNVLPPRAVGPRDRFEAFARSIRDVMSQRWVATEDTYMRENAKRVYYLSM